MSHADKERLRKIKLHCEKLNAAIINQAITKEKILQDEYTQWAITTPLFNIGEHVSHLSVELKADFPDIPWRKISALKNRIVHSYENTNWNMIVEVIFQDLPKFASDVEQILTQESIESHSENSPN